MVLIDRFTYLICVSQEQWLRILNVAQNIFVVALDTLRIILSVMLQLNHLTIEVRGAEYLVAKHTQLWLLIIITTNQNDTIITK